MIERLRHALRRETMSSSAPPSRPNQLSLEAARAERLRRESERGAQIRSVPERPPEEPWERQELMTATTRPRERKSWPVSARSSRSDMRRAWLLKEILGPPRALRSPNEDRPFGGH
jgi:hypothetical protein